eukprot:6177723-Pleurochrysis_carterae.AAC.5
MAPAWPLLRRATHTPQTQYKCREFSRSPLNCCAHHSTENQNFSFKKIDLAVSHACERFARPSLDGRAPPTGRRPTATGSRRLTAPTCSRFVAAKPIRSH